MEINRYKNFLKISCVANGRIYDATNRKTMEKYGNWTVVEDYGIFCAWLESQRRCIYSFSCFCITFNNYKGLFYTNGNIV